MNHHRYKKEKEFLPIIPGSSEIVSMAGDDKKIYYPVKHSRRPCRRHLIGLPLNVFNPFFVTRRRLPNI